MAQLLGLTLAHIFGHKSVDQMTQLNKLMYTFSSLILLHKF